MGTFRSLLFIGALWLLLHDCGTNAYKTGCLKPKEAKLRLDTAHLTLNLMEDVRGKIVLQEQTEECHTCSLINITQVDDKECVTLVDTRWPMRIQITSNSTKPTVNCSEKELSKTFEEGGNYTIYVHSMNGSIVCTKPLLRNQVSDNNIPIYVAIGVFVAAALAWIGLKRLWRSHCTYRALYRILGGSNTFLDPAVPVTRPAVDSSRIAQPVEKARRNKVRRRKGGNKNTFTEQDLGLPTNSGVGEEEEKKPRKERLKSLDTFRGISIVVMIFCNYGGGKYWFFKHSRWNGLTVADLVFPWFVFIMGTSMAYSFQTLLRRAVPRRLIFWKIVKRSIILFFLGLVINSGGTKAVELPHFRIPGVLQRLAGSYLITATIHMFFAKPNDPNQYNWWSGVRDLVMFWPEWGVNLLLVSIWLCLTFLLQVPGCPTGYLGPGGMSAMVDGQDVFNCTGGAAGYIDRTIFGEDHIYRHPTSMEIYQNTVAYDPEGLLGTLTSCFMCFLGLQAGKILVMFKDYKARMRRFFVWGVILGAIGALLCKCSKDDGWIPVNKNLWSLSFVLVLAGMAFLLLAFCYMMIDVWKLWSGAPFYYPGMNAILLYMGHEFFHVRFPVYWKVDANHASLLAINLWGTVFWVLVSYYLHYKQLFFSV